MVPTRPHTPRRPTLSRSVRAATLTGVVLASPACADDPALDPASVRAALLEVGLAPIEPIEPRDPDMVALGQALFVDPELSGNRDIACVTCHAPRFASADASSLAVGTGGVGNGPNRLLGPNRRIVARSTLELTNRGQPGFDVAGWDGAHQWAADGSIPAPAEYAQANLVGLDSPMASAAMFHLFDRDVMRGRTADVDVDGVRNEIADVDEFDLPGLSEVIAARVLALDGYSELVGAAFDDRDPTSIGTVDLANALMAFVETRFEATGSPYDRFLRGDDAALDQPALRGAQRFVDLGCAQCHSGPLLTDLRFHNLGVPQMAPGMLDEEPLDYGRGRESGRADERYHFRTPPLRNAARTGPWMHNGSFTTLANAIAAHADIANNVDHYDRRQLKPELQTLVLRSETHRDRLRSTLSLDALPRRSFDSDDVTALAAFIEAMTDPVVESWVELEDLVAPSGRRAR